MPLDKTNYILTAADVWTYATRQLTLLEARVTGDVANGATLSLDVSATMTSAMFAWYGSGPLPAGSTINCTALTANTISITNNTGTQFSMGIKAMQLQ